MAPTVQTADVAPMIAFLTEKAQRARDGAAQRRRLADAFAAATLGEMETGRRLFMAHGRVTGVNPFTEGERADKVAHDRMVAQRLDDEADALMAIAAVLQSRCDMTALWDGLKANLAARPQFETFCENILDDMNEMEASR